MTIPPSEVAAIASSADSSSPVPPKALTSPRLKLRGFTLTVRIWGATEILFAAVNIIAGDFDAPGWLLGKAEIVIIEFPGPPEVLLICNQVIPGSIEASHFSVEYTVRVSWPPIEVSRVIMFLLSASESSNVLRCLRQETKITNEIQLRMIIPDPLL